MCRIHVYTIHSTCIMNVHVCKVILRHIAIFLYDDSMQGLNSRGVLLLNLATWELLVVPKRWTSDKEIQWTPITCRSKGYWSEYWFQILLAKIESHIRTYPHTKLHTLRQYSYYVKLLLIFYSSKIDVTNVISKIQDIVLQICQF